MKKKKIKLFQYFSFWQSFVQQKFLFQKKKQKIRFIKNIKKKNEQKKNHKEE